MTSTKPYIVRAFYDWISDNDLTPYISVDVNVYGVLVPMAYVTDGQIVLNIASSAVGTINLGANAIEFTARFGGKLEHISVPYGAISAIYAKENGAGTSLEIEHETEKRLADVDQKPNISGVESNPRKTDERNKQRKKPSLTVVK